jgi:hypothetical protein
MSRELLIAYFEAIEQQLLALPNFYVEQFLATILFRYDSTPHFPELASFPHHKHLTDDVIAVDKPELAEVLQEASRYPD